MRRNQQSEVSEAQRRLWASQTRANLAIEGMYPSPESTELQELWIRGEISSEERRALLLEKYQEKSLPSTQKHPSRE